MIELKDEMNDTIKNEIFSLANEIQSINSISDVTHQLIEDFQDSFIDQKQEREKANIELRENLAKNNSLRRKDFDKMLKEIIAIQDESEKEVRSMVKVYLNEQREITHSLIENLGKFKNACIRGEFQEIKKLYDLIHQINSKQEKKKDVVTSKLKEFQKEQQKFTSQIKELLIKENNCRVRDFKMMLKEFKIQREKRTVLRRERKKDVSKMLSNFKNDRKKTVSQLSNTIVKSKENTLSQVPVDKTNKDGNDILFSEEQNKFV